MEQWIGETREEQFMRYEHRVNTDESPHIPSVSLHFTPSIIPPTTKAVCRAVKTTLQKSSSSAAASCSPLYSFRPSIF